MPETLPKTVVLLSDDSAHITAIKNTLRKINPLTCFIEANDSTAVFDFVNDASLVAFTPDLIVLDMDLQRFIGIKLPNLLFQVFGGAGCNIMLLTQENDPRCRLYSILYGFNMLYKPACTGNYKHSFTALLPAAMHTQMQ